MTSGQPMDTKGQMNLGASSVTNLGDPGVGDPNAGIEIPGTQFHGALKGRINDNVAIGFLYENGMDKGATKLNDSQPDVEGGNVEGYGVSMDFSIPTGNPQFSVGIGVDAMLWSVPYVEFATCARDEPCFPGTVMSKGNDSVGTLAASFTPSYKPSKDVAIFGQLTVRHHPTIDQKGQTVDPTFNEPEVEAGPANFIGAAGAEVTFADGALRASLLAYMDFSTEPAKYRPGVAMMLTVPFGKIDKTPPVIMVPGVAPPPPAYPTYPAPSPYPYPAPAPYPPPAPAPAPAPAPPPAAPPAPPAS
jgi:hypothetical protein